MAKDIVTIVLDEPVIISKQSVTVLELNPNFKMKHIIRAKRYAAKNGLADDNMTFTMGLIMAGLGVSEGEFADLPFEVIEKAGEYINADEVMGESGDKDEDDPKE